MPVEQMIREFQEKKKRLDDVEREGREATSEESYDKEFTKLREMSTSYKTGNVYSAIEGEKPCNTPKNRYKDIVPFDYTRVKLKNINDNSGSDYINASFIKGAVGGQKYIAAQGPMPKTVNDFWQIIWENDVRVMFMACREYEGDPPKLKCQRYWPNPGEEMSFGNIKVTLDKEETTQYKEHLIRHMTAKLGDESRKLVQLHYQEWPDRGVPRCIPGILDLIENFRNLQSVNSTELPPGLVHCSAGCGRTGTILVIDFVLSLLKYGKITDDFSVFNVIAEMRKQRMAIVQSLDQYSFVYDAVAELFNRQLINSHLYGNTEPSGYFARSKSQVIVPDAEYEFVKVTDNEKQKPAKPNSKPPLMSKPGSFSEPMITQISPTETLDRTLFGPTYSLAQSVSPVLEPQHTAPLVSPTDKRPLVRTTSKPKIETACGTTYGVVTRQKIEDTVATGKKGDYAYADPYQTGKWSLQGIARGKNLEQAYATVDELGFQGFPGESSTYAEISTGGGDFNSQSNDDNQGAPRVPDKRYHSAEFSGQQMPSKDRIPFFTTILEKLQPPTQQVSSGPFEIAQVFFRNVDISFPHRVGKPRGKRPVKMSQTSTVH